VWRVVRGKRRIECGVINSSLNNSAADLTEYE